MSTDNAFAKQNRQKKINDLPSERTFKEQIPSAQLKNNTTPPPETAALQSMAKRTMSQML
jgi:hypothetical protein